MKTGLHKSKDFWGGMMLLGTGATAMFVARDYRFGSTLNMGPGYFPTLLGAILVLFGVYVTVIGIRKRESIQGNCSPRALILLSASLVLFAVMIRHAGFIPAVAILVFVTAAAGKQCSMVEALILTVALTLFSTALFIWGLGLPYPLIKGF